jgi:hypothetical protein
MPRPRLPDALLTLDELHDQAVIDSLLEFAGLRLGLILVGHSTIRALLGHSPAQLRGSAYRKHQQTLRNWRAERAAAEE